MTTYRTCFPCTKRGDCEIQRALSLAIRDQGVTTITHRCKSFAPILIPGQHVWARVTTGKDADNHWDGGLTSATFPAVFLQFSRKMGRAVVWIETGAKSRDGAHEFKPRNKNACKVSFAPLRSSRFRCEQFTYRSIIELREGSTPLCGCCGNPNSGPHHRCDGFDEEAA